MTARNERLQLNSPCGRVIMGSVSELRTKSKNRSGQMEDCAPFRFFAVAFPKNGPGVTEMLQAIMGHNAPAYSQVPTVHANLMKGLGQPPGVFAWKIDDGDSPDNVTNADKAGNWILKFSTQIVDAIKCCDRQNVQIDPAIIKNGYFVDVCFTTCINGNDDATAGIYLSPMGVRFLDYGTEIVGGQDVGQMFGAVAAPTNIPGATAMPVAPAGGIPMTAAPAVPLAPTTGVPTMVAPDGLPQPAPVAPAVVIPGPSTASPSNPAVPQHHGIMPPIA